MTQLSNIPEQVAGIWVWHEPCDAQERTEDSYRCQVDTTTMDSSKVTFDRLQLHSHRNIVITHFFFVLAQNSHLVHISGAQI